MIWVRLEKFAGCSNAGIVHQRCNGSVGSKTVADALHIRMGSKVGLYGLNLAACSGSNLLGNVIELVLAACDQDQVVAALCKPVSIDGADACGSAGDEGSAFTGMVEHVISFFEWRPAGGIPNKSRPVGLRIHRISSP